MEGSLAKMLLDCWLVGVPSPWEVVLLGVTSFLKLVPSLAPMEVLRVGGLAVAERSRGGRLPAALLVLSLIVVGLDDFGERTCTLG